MALYFYDTEFLDDGSTIDLISIGIVCDDGREYYAVNSDLPIDLIRKDNWLMTNVVPHLPITGRESLNGWLKHSRNSYPQPGVSLVDVDRKDTRVKPKWVIANEVREFLLGHPPEEKSELWAYYAAYDHVALAQLWGPMINMPKGIPRWTHDIMQLIDSMPGLPDLLGGPVVEHNALEDARWNKRIYNLARTRLTNRMGM